jgi:spore germination protein YaaH
MSSPLSSDAETPSSDNGRANRRRSPLASDAETPVSGSERARRRVVVPVLGALLALVIGVSIAISRADSPPPPRPDIPLDVWAPYWTLGDSLPELENRIGSMREVSPFWFNATEVDAITVDPNAKPAQIAEFMSIARSSDARIVPSIIDALPAGEMAAILSDPAMRTRHIEALVTFAADYDGIDLDYEKFAFADGRASWAATRPNWVVFIGELSAALHADGKTLTVSIPPVFDDARNGDSGYWVYDYGAIASSVDRIRIMAYDFSVDEPGPIAPTGWVESAIVGAIEATDAPEKLVLGVPAYGRNWPTFVAGDCPQDGVPGRTGVTARSVDDLIERRTATPVFVETTGEWTFEYDLEITDGNTTCVQTRQVNYVDGLGVRLRMDLARQYQLGGISLWAFGFEDDEVWSAILPTVTDLTEENLAPAVGQTS